MKLNFIKDDDKIHPICEFTENVETVQRKIEDVMKCTISSSPEGKTVMTVTVFIEPSVQPVDIRPKALCE